VALNTSGATFLSANASETFKFSLINDGAAQAVTATVTGTTSGLSENDVLSQLNTTLNQYGITAQVGSDGQLQFAGSTAFTVSAATTDTTDAVATAASTASNSSLYNVQGEATFAPQAETLSFQNGSNTAAVTLSSTGTLAQAITAINNATSSLGIYAVKNAAGTGISFQSGSNFSVSTNTAAGVFTATGVQTVTAPVASATSTGNATSAITAINNALQQLGQAQAAVGAGENKLQYAINLANSQITNFSSAQSQIRDADVATEAANLSQAQVLEQASVAAMAQANAAPQGLLKLLQG
jgi:flagellin